MTNQIRFGVLSRDFERFLANPHVLGKEYLEQMVFRANNNVSMDASSELLLSGFSAQSEFGPFVF